MRILPSLLLTGLLLTPALSHATTVYTDSGLFMAALTGRTTYTEEFSTAVVNTDYSASGFTYSVISAVPGSTDPAISDGSVVQGVLFESTLTISFTSGNVTAVGGNFYQTDLAGFVAQPVKITLSNGTVDEFTPGAPSDYRGYVAAPGALITSLSFTGIPGDEDGVGGAFATVDNLTVAGAPVPEPAGTALAAIAGLTLLGRRRRSSAAV